MILVKDTDAKSVNAAILALNDDLDKQVKAVKNTNAGIVEGETYNINISGSSGSSGSVKNALTITSTTGYTAPSTTVYDGSEAKTINIEKPINKVFLGNLTVGNYSIDISKYSLIEATLYTDVNVNSAVSTVSAAIDVHFLQNTFYFTSEGATYKGATCLVISSKKIVQVYKYDFSGYNFGRLAVYGIYL